VLSFLSIVKVLSGQQYHSKNRISGTSIPLSGLTTIYGTKPEDELQIHNCVYLTQRKNGLSKAIFC